MGEGARKESSSSPDGSLDILLNLFFFARLEGDPGGLGVGSFSSGVL